MSPFERESLLIVSGTLALALRRFDDNAADALALLNQTLAAWAEHRIRRHEVRRNLAELHEALRRTPRRASPGAFARIHERLVLRSL
jgi:hypothetical protein